MKIRIDKDVVSFTPNMLLRQQDWKLCGLNWEIA